MHTIRVFISSPADVAEERYLARGVAERLQGEFGGRLNLQTFFWEQEPLLASADFQTQIESPADYDIFVAILWSRLGSRLPERFTRPDGSRYDSGTEFEYELALRAFQETGKPEILVYRKTATITAALDDEAQVLEQLEQKKALRRFVDKWFVDADQTAKAAYHEFDKADDFESIFEVHLRKLVALQLGDSDTGALAPDVSWTDESPFRGLNTFEYEHADIFFGRTRATAEVLDALHHQAESGKAFVLILGMSGGGKSSLARAGVVPMLTRSGTIKGVSGWRRALFSPGDIGAAPMLGLVRALGSDGLPELAERMDQSRLLELLSTEPDALADHLREILEPGNERLVLLVDQLEEMFTHRAISAEDRRVFVDALAALCSTGWVWIIATMRSDFYPRSGELPVLMALKEGRGQYDLAPPSPGEIAQMIRFPARVAGLRFEENTSTGERLDDVLRDHAFAHPEVLPLLEFTLEELFQRRSAEGVLTFAAYQEIGGVEGSVARRAESVFEALPADVQGELHRTLDLLVTQSATDRDAVTRLKAGTEEFSERGRSLVDAFVNARLFVAELENETDVVVRVAHEALIKQWPRIQSWLAENEEDLRLHARLADAATRWQQEPTADLLLPEGKPLEEARLLQAHGFELNAAEQTFVRRSEEKQARNRLIRRSLTAALVVLTLATAIGAGVAVQQSRRVQVEAETAEATTRFLVDLFRVSDPWRTSGAIGPDVSTREILDRGAAATLEQLEDQPRVQANLLDALGNVYQGLGLLDQAKPLIERSLATRRKLLGNQHPAVADSLQSLSYVLISEGRYADTERVLREAEAIRRANYGDDGVPLAYTLTAMSVVIAQQDRLDEAISVQREAIRILEVNGTLNSPEGIYAYNNLGYVYDAADRHTDAIEAFTLSEQLAEEAGATGLRARSLSNLAASYQALGQLDRARELHEQALRLKRQWFPEGHVQIGYSLNNLASLATDQGRFEDAIELYDEAIEIFTASLGESHPNVAVVQSNLARAFLKLGQLERARTLYQTVLDHVEANGGAGTSQALSPQIGLGRTLHQLGLEQQARVHLEQAVTIGMKVNPESRRTALALAGLASLESTALSAAEREAMFEQALSNVTRALGGADADRAIILLDYARFLDGSGRGERAAELFAEGLEIEAAILPASSNPLRHHRAEFADRFGDNR